MSKPLQKKLMGSVNYSISMELLQKIENLEEIYVEMKFFFNQRVLYTQIVENFYLLIRELAIFWEDEAKLVIYPRRMATWLSNYLEEIGYPMYDFKTVLDMIMRIISERDVMADLQNILGNLDPDVKPRMRKLDLILPDTDVGGFLANEIDNQLIPLPKTIESSILYVDQDGNLESIKAEQEIVKVPDSDIGLSTTTMFENPLDVSLTNVQVNNIVPYGYKVMDSTVEGFEDLKPTKKLLDEGLQLTWTIPEIKPKQEAKVDVSLERRISRTILFNIEKETTIIETWFNIIPIEKKYSANDSFTNIYPNDIDNLIIEDEIPLTFNLLEVNPNEEVYTFNPEMDKFENLVKWKYGPAIQNSKKFEQLYYLKDHPIFILNQYLAQAKDNDLPIKIFQLIEPSIMYNELIVSYYLKFQQETPPEFYIKEKVPEEASTSFQYPKSLEKSIEVIDADIHQVWRILPLAAKRIEFGYVCSGITTTHDLPISIVIPEKGTRTPTLLSSDTNTESFFIPDLHEYVDKFKRKRGKA
ncbi:MAG: hypothetical protein ACFFCS_07895 [Candidatus Hodarchaeota archaeon]